MKRMKCLSFESSRNHVLAPIPRSDTIPERLEVRERPQIELNFVFLSESTATATQSEIIKYKSS